MPSQTWEDLVAGYARYRALPVWGRERGPSNQGLLTRPDVRAMRDRGRAAADRLREAVEQLRRIRLLPESPAGFTQRHVDQIARQRRLSRERFQEIWQAVILDREGYACGHCGRSAWAVWEEEGRRRALALAVDSRRPRVRYADIPSLEGSLAACTSCLAIRGDLPTGPFHDELRSLAQAVARGGGSEVREARAE